MNLEPITINLETATPFGLIVNELVCNAFQHSLIEGQNGLLALSLSQQPDGLISLVVTDNGPGFPPGLDFRQTDSLGWQLICLLTEQLEGEIEVNTQGGVQVTLTFRELHYHNRLGQSDRA